MTISEWGLNETAARHKNKVFDEGIFDHIYESDRKLLKVSNFVH